MRKTFSQTQSLRCDVAVVGAGAAGLAAAVTVAEAGARVLVLEKMAAPGGASSFAEGMFAVETRHQKRKNIAITKEEAFRNLMAYSHWRANSRLVRAIVDKSADTIEWLEKRGTEFTDVRTTAQGGLMTWHMLKGRGVSVIRALASRLKEERGTLCCATTVKKIVTDKSGKTAGLRGTGKQNQFIEVDARAVVIATGGFANNKRMLAKHTHFAAHLEPLGNRGRMGEGIKMAWSAGAAEEGTDVIQLRGPIVPGEKIGTVLSACAKQPYLWVNRDGERFCDESIALNWPYAGNAIGRQPGQILYLIFDTTTKEHMIKEGVDIGVGDFIHAGTKLVSLDDELKRGTDRSVAFVAGSLTELANQIQVNQQTLDATVQEYNTMCDRREDTLFGKNPKWMR
jgi:fumarate reductase flavoprotein subunit